MERVKTIMGDVPAIVIAPHVEDKNTDKIAEVIAKELDTFTIINKGWNRSNNFDYWNDLANCNNIQHLQQDVIKQEFLDPIIHFKNIIQKTIDQRVFVFIIHGVGNHIRNKAPDLDMIIGHGAGTPPKYSCNLRFKDGLAYFLDQQGIVAYEGKAGGKYAGKSKNNLNQLFRQWYHDSDVHSFQLEIVKEFREDQLIELTGQAIASVIDDMIFFDDTSDVVINPKSI